MKYPDPPIRIKLRSCSLPPSKQPGQGLLAAVGLAAFRAKGIKPPDEDRKVKGAKIFFAAGKTGAGRWRVLQKNFSLKGTLDFSAGGFERQARKRPTDREAASKPQAPPMREAHHKKGKKAKDSRRRRKAEAAAGHLSFGLKRLTTPNHAGREAAGKKDRHPCKNRLKKITPVSRKKIGGEYPQRGKNLNPKYHGSARKCTPIRCYATACQGVSPWTPKGRKRQKGTMAIGHVDRQIVARSKGQSIMAKAAYNSCSRLAASDGEKDFRKKGGLIFDQMITQDDTPLDRQTFWQAVDRTEKRKDSQLGYSYEAALPIELTKTQQIELAQDFARQILARYDFPAVDLCIHHPTKRKKNATGKENPHIHLLTSTRTKDGKKLRLYGDTDDLLEVRHLWEETANRHLAAAGIAARISVDTLEKQIAEKEAQLTKVEEEIKTLKNELQEAEDGRLDLKTSHDSLQTPERESRSVENTNSRRERKGEEGSRVQAQLAWPGGHTGEESRQNRRKNERNTGLSEKTGDLDGKPVSADRPGLESDGRTRGWAIDHSQPRGDAGRHSAIDGGHGQSMEKGISEASHTDSTAAKAKHKRPGLLIAKKIKALKDLIRLQKALVEKKAQEYRQFTDEKLFTQFTQRRKANANTNRNNSPSRETAPAPAAPHP